MSLPSARSLARLRLALCSSAGVASLVIAGAAHAQSDSRSDLTTDYREAHSTGASVPLISVAPSLSITRIESVAPEPQVVIANPNTPTTARDPVNVNGIGQMVVSNGGGSVGLCTGSLINPRTVLFAAHCVNSRAAADYGSNSGGVPIAFGFSNSNNTAGNSIFGRYLSTLRTNTADFLYNVNQVTYNPQSLEPASQTFLYADIALASLDTPAKGIPTWALLFSALPARPITAATGAGYHVTISGYGNNGTGTTGSTGGIDFRRRVAENFIGGLASLDEFQNFLFGSNGTANPQNLYWIDFDDPRRGTAAADPRDFNAWRDNAVANGREGITASGDSGGPLILDQTFAKQLVIGVLSGGFTRFFNGQPPNGYGTASFYQPLYVYWDWIAANNPYRYVSAVAGNGNWTDQSRWVTNIDPNYNIIGGNGQLVNGVPTTAGVGNQEEPGWGQACFQSGGTSECRDIATGVDTIENKPIGTGGDEVALSNGMGSALVSSIDGAGGATASTGLLDPVSPTAQAVIRPTPPPTIGNGLPGATGFVPNNTDGNRTTGTAARYYDVTLSAAGTTTLSSAVTIDQFNITGGGAALDITSTGSLTSLMGINQMTGTMQVNGRLITPGDYMMMSGGLNGTGTITTPFFTNLLGVISPATTTTIGTLTFQGNIILTSGSVYLANLGANGTSDPIAVTATTFGANNAPTNGIANVGGAVMFAGVAGTPLIAGNSYTILTAQGGVTGRFNTPSALSAILTPTLTYTATSVQARLTAGLFANVVTRSSPVQVAYAQLLDQNRAANQGLLSALFTPLDLANAATIQATLESLAPRTETLNNAIGTVAVDNMARFFRERVNMLQPGKVGNGSLAVTGQPLKLAALNMNAMPGQEPVRTDAGDTMLTEGVLPDTVSAFLAGGYLDGKSRGMATALPIVGRDTFDGYYVAGGLEIEVSDKGALGFALSYTDIDGQTAIAGQTASGQLYQGTVYGKLEANAFVLDGVFSAGLLDSKTRRETSIVGTNYTLRSKSGSLALSGEVGVGVNAELGAIKVGPRAAIRASRITFDNVAETGGGPALTYFRDNLDSLQARGGVTLGGGARFRPFASAYYVHDFEDRPASFGANFVGGVGPQAVFALTGQDQDWAEVGGGIAFGGEKAEFSISADTTIERKDVQNQSYRASVKIRF